MFAFNFFYLFKLSSMKIEEALIEGQFESWERLDKLLAEIDLGNPTYINLSNVPVPKEIPKEYLPSELPTSKEIEFHLIHSYFTSEVSSNGMLIVRQYKLPIKGLRGELRYYIPGTSVPPEARKKYNLKTLLLKVYRANIENCFRLINSPFYFFVEYFRYFLHGYYKPKRPEIEGTLDKILKPYVDTVSDYTVSAEICSFLEPYVRAVSDIFLSKLLKKRLESILQEESVKDIMKELKFQTETRSLIYAMENPWKILEDSVKENDIDAQSKISDMKGVHELFSKHFTKVYKLEIIDYNKEFPHEYGLKAEWKII